MESTANKENRLKVCIICSKFFPIYSGAGLQAQRLADKFLEKNIKCFVVSIREQGLKKREKINGLDIYRVFGEVGRWSNLGLILFWLNLFYVLFKTRKDYDIIYTIGGFTQLSIVGFFSKILKKKTVVKITLANSDLKGIGEKRWGKLQFYFLTLIDAYVSISDEITYELRAAGLDNKKIVEFPNGVDTDIFRPVANIEEKQALRSKFQLENDETIACFVGVINQRKGVDLLVKAWGNIQQKGIEGKLLLIGPDEDNSSAKFYNEIKSLIKSFHLHNSLIFWGIEEDIPELLRCCDLLVLPSRGEGMPNIVLEAMASGIPALVSSSSGTGSCIREGEAGLRFETNDCDEFVWKLEMLLTKKEFRTKLGVNARSLAEECFSLDALSLKYIDVFKSLKKGFDVKQIAGKDANT